MAVKGVRITIQLPGDLYDWLEPLIAKREASQYIVGLLVKARKEATK